MWLAWKILKTLLWRWQQKYTTQHYIIISALKQRALAPVQIPASLCEGHIFYFSCWVNFLFQSINSLVGKQHVAGKDPDTYIQLNISDHDSLFVDIIPEINKLGGETLSPYLPMCLIETICSKNMLWVSAIMED